MKVAVRIAGEAGQGLVTTGHLLIDVLTKYNVYIFTNQSYMSRIRGGLNWFDITISNNRTYSPFEISDILVALSKESLSVLKKNNIEERNIFFNCEVTDSYELGEINKIDFAVEAESKLMISSYITGLIIGLLGFDLDILRKRFQKIYNTEKYKSASENISSAEKGYRKGAEFSGDISFSQNDKTSSFTSNGAKAIGFSAAVSGIKFVSSYPMSPGTATFTYLSFLSDEYKILVEQAEDEIAAVNMICGAGYAGIPSMTCTSGGGLALMCEGISLAGIAEIPILVMVAQRPGPATGLPTRTAQEDLKLAINAGHGEFPKAVFAPGTIEECYSITRKALEIAHKYQTPVILLTDQYLQDHIENIEPFDIDYNPIDRHLDGIPDENYSRYQVNDGGISPRAMPGGKAIVISDSDEHNEKGNITEDLDMRIKMHKKRMRKLSGMIEKAVDPKLYGINDAEKLFICWGSSYGPCRKAVDMLNKNRIKSSMLHFSQVWPLNKEKIDGMIKNYTMVYVVEGNYTGQFGRILVQAKVISDYSFIARYDGLPLTAEYIINEVKNEKS